MKKMYLIAAAIAGLAIINGAFYLHKRGFQNAPAGHKGRDKAPAVIDKSNPGQPTSKGTSESFDTQQAKGKEDAPVQKASAMQKDTIPRGTRQKTIGERKTACTDAYEAAIEINENPSLVGTFSMDNDSSDKCMSELRNVLPEIDTYMGLLKNCESKKKIEPKESDPCLRVATILKLSLVENEYHGIDPSELTSPVLRSMIAFRALQFSPTDKTEKGLDYFLRLANEEQRLSPENDLGSLRALLIAQLVEKNPEKYDADFEQTVLDIEQKNPDSALSSRLMRYKIDLANSDLISEVDSFLDRYPDNPYGIYVKSAILARKNEWEAADKMMAKAVSLAQDKEFYVTERAKFARKEKGITIRANISISL